MAKRNLFPKLGDIAVPQNQTVDQQDLKIVHEPKGRSGLTDMEPEALQNSFRSRFHRTRSKNSFSLFPPKFLL